MASRTRLSLVAMRSVPPACAASGGLLWAATALQVVVRFTLPASGVPVMRSMHSWEVDVQSNSARYWSLTDDREWAGRVVPQLPPREGRNTLPMGPLQLSQSDFCMTTVCSPRYEPKIPSKMFAERVNLS